MQQSATRPHVRPLRLTDDQIDCPECGPGMTARLVIREANSGIAIVACLGCKKLYPAELTRRQSKPETRKGGARHSAGTADGAGPNGGA
jgi:hypothetical protein